MIFVFLKSHATKKMSYAKSECLFGLFLYSILEHVSRYIQKGALMKKLLSNKAYGFFVTLSLAVLSIVTMIVYLVSYKGVIATNSTKEIFSWPAFIFLLVFVVLFVCSLFIRNYFKYLNYIACVCLTLSFCFFVYGIYYQVSVMATGIDAKFNFTFFFNTFLFAILWIVSIANVFLPQEKKTVEAIKE